jgi:hypothetical protein
MPHQETTRESTSSIVVLGHLNPAIHHPAWYRMAQLLSDDEVALAMKRPMFITPDMSQFESGAIRIACLRDRWEIVSTDIGDRPRLASIAADVFDGKLKETPIALLAFNNDFRCRLNVESVQRLLASCGEGAFGLTRFGPTSLSVGVSIKSADGGEIRIRIEPALNASDKVFVGVNSNHPVVLSGPGYFELKGLLDAHFDADFYSAQGYLNAVLSALSEKATK